MASKSDLATIVLAASMVSSYVQATADKTPANSGTYSQAQNGSQSTKHDKHRKNIDKKLEDIGKNPKKAGNGIEFTADEECAEYLRGKVSGLKAEDGYRFMFVQTSKEEDKYMILYLKNG